MEETPKFLSGVSSANTQITHAYSSQKSLLKREEPVIKDPYKIHGCLFPILLRVKLLLQFLSKNHQYSPKRPNDIFVNGYLSLPHLRQENLY